jgi:hypothetical protein
VAIYVRTFVSDINLIAYLISCQSLSLFYSVVWLVVEYVVNWQMVWHN